MIEILSGKAAELAQVYHDPRPVLRVTHQLKREHVMEIVRLAVEQYGPAILGQCGLPVPEQPKQQGGSFYCWVPGRSLPSVAHSTVDKALCEAQRLIGEGNADRVIVSRSVHVVEVKRSVVVSDPSK